MSGYTPVFDTVFAGTLCGKWPALPVWLTVLPMADKNGRIDMTPEAIAALTGWPIEMLMLGLEQLCKADPRSRSKDEDGARLKLLEEDRDWGWQVVNHMKYREKARLMGKNETEVLSGKNRDRLNDRRSPPTTAAHRPSDSYADTDSNSDSGKETTALRTAPHDQPAEFVDFKIAYPKRSGDQGWRKAIRAANARIAEGHTWAEMVGGAARYAEYVRSTGSENTEYVKQAATFLGPDKPFLEDWSLPPTKAQARLGANIDSMNKFLSE